MGDNNGIVIKKVPTDDQTQGAIFKVYECDLSSGNRIYKGSFTELERALEYASDQQTECGVTYENGMEQHEVKTTMGELIFNIAKFSNIPHDAQITIKWVN